MKDHLSGFAVSLSFFVPLLSRAFSHARGHLLVSGVLLDGPEKRETAHCLLILLLLNNFMQISVDI